MSSGSSDVLKRWSEMEATWAEPGSEGDRLRIHEFPTFHLLRLATLAKASVAREYLEPAGISVPEWRLLAAVVNFSPIPFSELTAITTMDKGQVSRTLRSAQAKGYIATEVVPMDRRGGEAGGSSISRVVVSITPAGRALYERVMPIAQRYQVGMLELLSADERRVLLDVLHRLYHYLAPEPGNTRP
jgi:DNA-binding MarR family transcriptional regulator